MATTHPDLQYILDDVPMDIWTDEYRGRVTLERICVKGSSIDIQNILSREQIEQIREFAELSIAA